MSPERFRELGLDPDKRDYSIEDVLEIAIRAGQHAGHRSALDAQALEANKRDPLFLTEARVQEMIDATMEKSTRAVLVLRDEQLADVGIDMRTPEARNATREKIRLAFTLPTTAATWFGYAFKGALGAAGISFFGYLMAKFGASK